MPGPKLWKETDPQGKGRGRGYYYHRGLGVYSKYGTGPKSKDAMIIRGPIRDNSRKKDPYSHTHDYNVFDESPSYPTNTKFYGKKHELKDKTKKRRIKSIRRFRSFKTRKK